jgi:hypothetical protein
MLFTSKEKIINPHMSTLKYYLNKEHCIVNWSNTI